MTNAFANLIKEVRKISDKDVIFDCKSDRENKTTYYYKVGDNSVMIKIFLKGVRIYRKEFECDCKHASLFGTVHNIPCKHIFKLIQYVCNHGIK